jgi:predicted adenine nucleotide alpha hydrolase (AANH) superfamily ATPase
MKGRKQKYCSKLGIELVDCDYDVKNWYKRAQGMEFDPERGRQCTECFDVRVECTTLYAHGHGFDAITEQVDTSGYQAVKRYADLVYWCQNWQSDELRKYKIAASNTF